MGLFGEGKRARQAKAAANKAEQRLNTLLSQRQEVINPYAAVSDLSSMITNPFANLQVATQAAEMQARETDISLASTLDALRATGAGAGGATALAQAAARSKQGIAASIEQQEAANAQMRARGEAQAMQMRIGEAQRMQEADIMGQQFVFGATEQRQVAEMSRQAQLQQQYAQQYQDIKAGNRQLFGQIVGGALSAFGAAAPSIFPD
jgi:hypothetical protein